MTALRKVAYRDLSCPAQHDCDRLVELMRDAEPTPFRWEADAVFMLRARRCLSGWRFDAADLAARDIVQVALNRIGAVRPKWEDGQPVPQADPGRGCIVCGAPLYGSFELVYCSQRCDIKRQCQQRSAAQAKTRANMSCAHCGKPFTPSRADAKYCSRWCATVASREHIGYDPERDLATDHQCLWCGSTFRRYAPPSRKPKFCCHSCQHHWRWAQRGEGPRPVRAGSAEAREVLPARLAQSDA